MSEKKDRGAALLVVMGIGLVMVLLISTSLTVALSGMRQASSEANANAALDAAYAGVQDYLARVNADASYTAYGNPASTFSSGSTLKPPPKPNAAFNIKAGQAWAPVPGSQGRASFRYEVDTSSYKTTGVVRLRATGLVGSTTRSVLSNIRVRGFVDYIYFTEYELSDPKLTGQPATCEKHLWEGRSASCGTISFLKDDHLNGPVHSNDTLSICGTTFDGAVTTANTATPIYSRPAGCALLPHFGPANIVRAPVLPMPPTNSGMKADTQPASTTNPGCLYTGPTQVTYNANGTMTVVSPWTKDTGGSASECGQVVNLHSATGATVPQLDANLLYVQDVPGVTSDPNYASTDASSLPSGFQCFGSDGSSVLSGSDGSAGWSFGGTRYPASGEAPPMGWHPASDPSQWDTSTPAYGCRSGDLFVKGTVASQTTAGSDNYVYVTGDIKYGDKNSDVLGLVGQNGVIVWNPVSAAGTALTGNNREIDAALVSVAHSFQVQNPLGPLRGTLTLFGSLAQEFRGAVSSFNPATGTILSGYAKNYAYDPLLFSITPPKFLQPSAVSFQLIRYASVTTAFDASGAAR